MKTNTLKRQLGFALMLLTLASATLAADFPARDIRFIVPWPAGGSVDAISRKINSIAEKDLPVSIYVENIGGAVTATGLMQMSCRQPHSQSWTNWSSSCSVAR